MLDLSHKKLDVWQISVDFVVDIYDLINCLPKSEEFGLKSQLRRASISIPSNIAEGAARKSKIEKNRFFEISRSSLVECDTQLEIAKKLKYLNDDQLMLIEDKLNHIFAMLSNMIRKNRA